LMMMWDRLRRNVFCVRVMLCGNAFGGLRGSVQVGGVPGRLET
jgi:hypothetical protein